MHLSVSESTQSFPTVVIPPASSGSVASTAALNLPIEVVLIAQLGHGAGSQIITATGKRQKAHSAFVDALDEPSTCIGPAHFAQGDTTALYTFSVGENAHPFHRHAGHRVFTAISGSAGTQLRFSTASDADIAIDPQRFFQAMHLVDIPADCMFAVRFGGGTWHQFAPLVNGTRHPAMFALSCHTNELGGALSTELRDVILAGEANIPALTELLPSSVVALMQHRNFDWTNLPRVSRIALSVDEPASRGLRAVCSALRSLMGRGRALLARMSRARGYLYNNAGERMVVETKQPPAHSILNQQLAERFEHQDCFTLTLDAQEVLTRMPTPTKSARTVLEVLLDAFVEKPPLGVTGLMQLRNVLVAPFGLRTSPLGCPVSSLLQPQSDIWFASRLPVHAQSLAADDQRAEVVLGADDKHLRFRTAIAVEYFPGGGVQFTMATRVQYKNLFGYAYLMAIDAVHRKYVSPTLLSLGVEHALQKIRLQSTARTDDLIAGTAVGA